MQAGVVTTRMDSAQLPPTLRFTIDAPTTRDGRDSSAVRERNSKITNGVLLALLVVSLAINLEVRRDPVDLTWLGLCLSLFAWQFARSFDFEHTLSRPNTPTTIAFAEDGIEIARVDRAGRETKRFVPLARIRAVRVLKNGLTLVIGETSFFLPTFALGDAGDAVMAYLDDRVVGRRLLHRAGTRYRRTGGAS